MNNLTSSMYIKQQSKKRKQTNKKLGPKEKKEAINQTSSEEKVIVEAFQPKKDNWKTKNWKKMQDFKPSQAWQVDLPRVAGPTCHVWQVDLPQVFSMFFFFYYFFLWQVPPATSGRSTCHKFFSIFLLFLLFFFVAGPTCHVWQVDLPQVFSIFVYFFF